MLKVSDYLYVDKKHVVRQIIDDLLKSINKHLSIKDLTETNDSYLYIEDDPRGNEQLILVHGWEDSHGKWIEKSREVVSEKASDINKYYAANTLIKVYL